jgi:hypothetical protein
VRLGPCCRCPVGEPVAEAEPEKSWKLRGEESEVGDGAAANLRVRLA